MNQAPSSARCGTFNFSPLDHPCDILANTASVTHFLAEVAIHVHSDGLNPGLSEEGAQGLWCILTAVENSIQAAIERYNPQLQEV